MRRDEVSKRALRELVGHASIGQPSGSSDVFADSRAAADPVGGNEKALTSRAF
jgi:hypothetical protein